MTWLSKYEAYALGHRAVAAHGWRWLPGMLTWSSDGLSLPYRLTAERRPNWPDEYDWPHDLGLRWPDLSDQETLDRLHELVSMAHPDAVHVSVYRNSILGSYIVQLERRAPEPKMYVYGSTKAGALVAALEAAQTTSSRPAAADRQDDLLSRVEAAEAEVVRLRQRLTDVAQILIAEVGAPGPWDAEDAAREAVARLRALSSPRTEQE